ncbi:MAG: type VI secretion system contractile sheath large subunit [Acetobacteraceae bacterium]|nr:type VI secretion system contractile sheath large subunit [Acetobacteraceae bacterium]
MSETAAGRLEDDPDFTILLERELRPLAELPHVDADGPPLAWMRTLASLALRHPELLDGDPRRTVEALIAEIDLALSGQLDAILHAPDFQRIEASWRGLFQLVRASDKEGGVKVKALNVGKRELQRTLRKFRGNAWDQSPIFKKLYEEEFGQFGGEPYGLLVGDYTFDHRPEDVALLTDIAMIAAAAHAPFISSAAPSLLQMDDWSEVANPRDLGRIFSTPEYVAWRSLREGENARYLGLCAPRYLARLPYGANTDPLDAFAFEEDTHGATPDKLLWGNPAYAFAANVARAFALYGWCSRIRGIDRGGVVEDLPVLHHPTADGDVDRRTVTEICLSERREAELSLCGLIPLVHRKNSDVAAFISANSLQKPQVYDDPDATANAALSARLPYLFASCRFAHYLKCMVRDKIGSSMSRNQINSWLAAWIIKYVDGSPMSSSEDFKASHPLAAAKVVVEEKPDKPGEYEAKFFITPHYQLEGATVSLRLVSNLTPG